MNPSPRVTFYSGVGTVTGANFLVETISGTKVMIDCGLIQGEQFSEETNREPFHYEPSSIHALIITHAHLDHVGRIPKLVRDGFKGPIYSTLETRELAELVLNDAVGILGMEARQNHYEPLYGAEDVGAIFPLWKTFDYHHEFSISPDISVVFKDAGHILGSAMVEVTLVSKKILFTGDLGNSPAPLLRDTEPAGDIDCLVMESTYGDRNHEDREKRTGKLEEVVKDTITRGGTLIIPSFSIDRTQVLLYELNNMVEKKKIPSIPVFVDSPMAIRATEIYASHKDLFNDRVRAQIAKGDDIFAFPHLEYTILQSESRDIGHIRGAKIILAGSGMSVGGRVTHHEEKYLPDSRNTVLLVGYQTAGSLGRRLSDGATKVNIHGKSIDVKARIETLYGYSAHKDGDRLLEFVATGGDRLKQVFVVMGEPGASMHMAQRINNELGVQAIVPERDMVYELK